MGRFEGDIAFQPRWSGKVEGSLFLNNQNLVVLDGLKYSKLGGAYVSGASVTARVVNLSGTTLTGGTTSLTYVTNSAGRYEGYFSVITSLVEGSQYFLKVSAVSSGNTIGFWQQRFIAHYRRED